jgi:hypothetical protein
MRRFVLIGLLALAACKQEQSFDERYQAAQQQLEAKASGIEQELGAAQSDAAEADALATGT